MRQTQFNVKKITVDDYAGGGFFSQRMIDRRCLCVRTVTVPVLVAVDVVDAADTGRGR